MSSLTTYFSLCGIDFGTLKSMPEVSINGKMTKQHNIFNVGRTKPLFAIQMEEFFDCSNQPHLLEPLLQPMSLILPWKSFQLQPVTLIRDGVEISAMLLMPFMHSARTLWGQFRDATGRSGSSGTLEEANNLGVEKVLDACVWDRVGWIRKRQGWWLVRWYQPTRRQPLALISLCVGQVGHPPKCDQFLQGEVFPRLERKMPAVEHFGGRKSVR